MHFYISQDSMNVGNKDAQEFFESYVKPALVNRIPAFKNLEVFLSSIILQSEIYA